MFRKPQSICADQVLRKDKFGKQCRSVLMIDSRRFRKEHSEQVLLTPKNSGCTEPYPHLRGDIHFRTALRLAIR